MASRNATLFFRLLLLTAFIALLLAWWCIPSVNVFIDHSLTAFLAVDQQGIERFIHSYGSQAAAVSFVLMIFQAVAAPLPAFLITFANASLFGAFWGGIADVKWGAKLWKNPWSDPDYWGDLEA